MRAKTKKEKYQKIMEKKIACTPDEICKTYPEEFIVYFQYCRGLQFEEKPDYNYIRSLFKIILERYNYEYDFKYDWNLIKKVEEEEKSTEPVTIENLKTREGNLINS
jgi:hypothetical protein